MFQTSTIDLINTILISAGIGICGMCLLHIAASTNLNKVIRASVLQIACIRYLQSRGSYERLPEKVKETAELRLKHPDISLNDLVEFTDGAIGKSGLNHRLKKIQQTAVNEGMDISEYI